MYIIVTGGPAPRAGAVLYKIISRHQESKLRERLNGRSGMEFTITDVSGLKVIKPSGRIDWESARLLDKEIQRLVDEKHYRIAFNLDDITFICSGGIGAFVYNLNKLRKLGGAIYIIADNDYINFVFESLKFDLIFAGYMFRTFEEFSEAVLDKIDKG
jgi:anti-anti-sigma factor